MLASFKMNIPTRHTIYYSIREGAGLSGVGDVVFHGLSLESRKALSVVDGRVDRVFDASLFFGFLSIVPTVEGADEITGNAAKAFKFAFIEIFRMSFERSRVPTR